MSAEVADLTTQVAQLSVDEKATPQQQPQQQQPQQQQPQQQQAKQGGNANNNNNNNNKNKKAQPAKKGKGKKNDSDFDFDIGEFMEEKPQHDQKGGNKAGPGKGPQAQAAKAPVDPFAEMTDCTDHIGRKVGHKPADHKEAMHKNEKGEEIKQTVPPTIPPNKFFTVEAMPCGEFLPYLQEHNTYRSTSEELQEKEKITPETVKALREGAEIHRQARQDIQRYTRPGVKIIDLANRVERSVLTMVEANGYERTRGFPTGINLNHVAAHDSPNGGDTRVIKESDTIKLDFGVSINGTIIDSAFTMHFNEEYDPLVEAVRAATMEGIKHAGPDMRVGDLGGIINEVMESYEVTIGGKTLPVKAIQNLCGHEIGPAARKIHGGVSIPLYNNHDQTKMLEGRCYAIETFGTNDPLAKIREEGECSHYMREYDITKPLARSQGAIKLWNVINKRFNTLAFCRRWLDEVGEKDYILYLKQLCDAGSINPYPPLCVRKGYQTAQFEHTIFLHPTKTEVLSKDWDY